MSYLARRTDPGTSQHAANGVDEVRSNLAVLTFARTRFTEPFTQKELVNAYMAAVAAKEVPAFSDSRVRTCVRELERNEQFREVGVRKAPGARAMLTFEVAA